MIITDDQRFSNQIKCGSRSFLNKAIRDINKAFLKLDQHELSIWMIGYFEKHPKITAISWGLNVYECEDGTFIYSGCTLEFLEEKFRPKSGAGKDMRFLEWFENSKIPSKVHHDKAYLWNKIKKSGDFAVVYQPNFKNFNDYYLFQY